MVGIWVGGCGWSLGQLIGGVWIGHLVGFVGYCLMDCGLLVGCGFGSGSVRLWVSVFEVDGLVFLRWISRWFDGGWNLAKSFLVFAHRVPRFAIIGLLAIGLSFARNGGDLRLLCFFGGGFCLQS